MTHGIPPSGSSPPPTDQTPSYHASSLSVGGRGTAPEGTDHITTGSDPFTQFKQMKSNGDLEDKNLEQIEKLLKILAQPL